MNKYLKIIKFKLYKRVSNLLLELQLDYLRSKLKFCGSKFFCQMPIQISGLEKVEIGNNVSIAAYVHIWGEGGIKIGDRVMIASHAAISSLTHDYNQEQMCKTLIKAKVLIEDDVWIGAHSVILPGIAIGKGAVIGAGSVVTKNVEPYSIVFGNPAKHYKYRDINGISISKKNPS